MQSEIVLEAWNEEHIGLNRTVAHVGIQPVGKLLHDRTQDVNFEYLQFIGRFYETEQALMLHEENTTVGENNWYFVNVQIRRTLSQTNQIHI